MCNDSIQITKFSFIYPGFYTSIIYERDNDTVGQYFLTQKYPTPILFGHFFNQMISRNNTKHQLNIFYTKGL